MTKCRMMAVGFIIRPDGYRCELCEIHLAQDWPAVAQEGYTIGRRHRSDLNPNDTCQRIVPDVEVINIAEPPK